MGAIKAVVKFIVAPIAIVVLLAILVVVLVKIRRRRAKQKDIERGEFPPPFLPPPNHLMVAQKETPQYSAAKVADTGNRYG